MRRFSMPSAFTILFLIIIIVAVLTWIVPAGQYDYVDPEADKKEPIPGTYHEVKQNRQGLLDVAMAPIQGFYDAKDVALFVIVIGGFLGVIMKSGAIDAGIAKTTSILKGREKLMIPILMFLFGIGGTSYGMAEETIAFYPLLIPVFIAAGYDTVTAVSVILLGAGVGVLGSTVNPFATAIASKFAGIEIGQGIVLRLLMFIVCEIVAIIFVMRYARKVKEDPSKSLVYDMKKENRKHFLSNRNEDEFPHLTTRRVVILIFFALSFAIMIYGVIPFGDFKNDLISSLPTLGWWFGELTALFLVFAIVVGFIAGMNEKELASSFVEGARDLLGVALIVGLSRGITIVMNSGKITDTVLNLGETTLADTGSITFTILTYLFYIPLSFLIPSTSGLAALSMPIMAPLGDFANVSRDIVITAYQSASGIVNLVTPTSAVVMGGLAIARLPYDKWIKHVWKFLLVLLVITIVSLSLGVVLQ